MDRDRRGEGVLKDVFLGLQQRADCISRLLMNVFGIDSERDVRCHCSRIQGVIDE